MGLLRRILGLEKKGGKPYIDAGVALTHKLTTKLNLPGWKDLLPTYTEQEMEAINKRWSSFGGDAKFSSVILPDLRRTLAAQALAEHAGDPWKFSDQLPTNWRECVSTYLKAWAAHFDPLYLLDLGALLVRSGYRTEAKDVFQVVLLFPTYADTYYGCQQAPDLVRRIIDATNKSLQDLI